MCEYAYSFEERICDSVCSWVCEPFQWAPRGPTNGFWKDTQEELLHGQTRTDLIGWDMRMRQTDTKHWNKSAGFRFKVVLLRVEQTIQKWLINLTLFLIHGLFWTARTSVLQLSCSVFYIKYVDVFYTYIHILSRQLWQFCKVKQMPSEPLQQPSGFHCDSPSH